MVRIIADLASDWRQLDERIEPVTDEIEALAKSDSSCRRVMTVPGIDPLRSADRCAKRCPSSLSRVFATTLSRADRGPVRSPVRAATRTARHCCERYRRLRSHAHLPPGGAGRRRGRRLPPASSRQGEPSTEVARASRPLGRASLACEA
jgi:hypothetical protein